jgi:hypothetical protein
LKLVPQHVALPHPNSNRNLGSRVRAATAPPSLAGDTSGLTSTRIGAWWAQLRVGAICCLSPALPRRRWARLHRRGLSCESFWPEGIVVKFWNFPGTPLKIDSILFVSSEQWLVKSIEIHKKIRKMQNQILLVSVWITLQLLWSMTIVLCDSFCMKNWK